MRTGVAVYGTNLRLPYFDLVATYARDKALESAPRSII